MNPVVDTIMLVLFVLFLFYILRGYHHTKMLEREEQEKDKTPEEDTDKA